MGETKFYLMPRDTEQFLEDTKEWAEKEMGETFEPIPPVEMEYVYTTELIIHNGHQVQPGTKIKPPALQFPDEENTWVLRNSHVVNNVIILLWERPKK